jgi:phosphoadenosine phosphosulfate reductase
MTSSPGLDPSRLRALRGRQRSTTAIIERIAAHLDAHDGYVALSGGKDSVVATHLARQADPGVPVVWFDGGLDLPETRPYLERLTQRWNLNLTVLTVTPTGLQLLADAGDWDHQASSAATVELSEVLIDAPARAAHQLFGAGEIWGVRAGESTGRRHLYTTALRRQISGCADTTCCPAAAGTPTPAQRARHGGIVTRNDGTCAYGPIWDWPTSAVWEYLATHDIPAHPAYDTLRGLGAPEHALRISAVVTGALLDSGRITWLRRGWPQLYADLTTQLPRLAEFV